MTERGLWASALLGLLLLALVCTLHHFHKETNSVAGVTSPAVVPAPSVPSAPAPASVPPPVVSAPAAPAPVVPAPAAPAIEPALRADYNGTSITLNGIVPDQATKAGIVERARALYGADRVTDRIEVRDTQKPSWFATLVPRFPPDLRALQSGSLYTQDGALVLDGTVGKESDRSSLAGSLGNWFGTSVKVDNRLTLAAAPAAPSAAQAASPAPQTSTTVLYDLGSVRFRTSSAALSNTAKAKLRRIAGAIKQSDSASRYSVTGFADSRGSDEFNLKLSERRAKAVKAYLQRLGVAEDRLDVQAEGSAQPVGDNDTVAGRSANRRTEVRLL